MRFVPEKTETWPNYYNQSTWELWCKIHGANLEIVWNTCIFGLSDIEQEIEKDKNRKIISISVVRHYDGYNYTYTKFLTFERVWRQYENGEWVARPECVRIDFRKTAIKV